MKTTSSYSLVVAALLCIFASSCPISLSTRCLPDAQGRASILAVEPLHALEKQKSLSTFLEDEQVIPYFDKGPQEREEEEEEELEEQHQPEKQQDDEEIRGHESFVLEKAMKVMKTNAGEMRIWPGAGRSETNELVRKKIALGFLSLEPKTLLLPHYTDADCLCLVHKGKARLSWDDGEHGHEVGVEEGDVYRIEGGTVFHVINQDEGQRLSIFSIHETSTVFNNELFHSFFVAGGQKPKTILSGFDEHVLSTVFQAPADEVRDMLSSQSQGPIIYFNGSNKSNRRVAEPFGSSLTKMVDRYIGFANIFPKSSSKKIYNLFKKKADYTSKYGSTTTIHDKDFELLREVNKGVFLVKLKAGAVLAPHWNPRAMEIALVTKGEGDIQIVYPNGSVATTQRVSEGSVFYVPQYFPMCQIASRSGPFEFVGFTTSAKPNRPYFLAGSNSVLKEIDAEVLASSFNIPIEQLQNFLDLQSEAIVLPG